MYIDNVYNVATYAFIWATSWENQLMPYANNKGADLHCVDQTTKAQISLRIRAVWSAPLLLPA